MAFGYVYLHGTDYKSLKKKMSFRQKLGQKNIETPQLGHAVCKPLEIYGLRVRRGSGDNSWQDVIVDKNNRADGGEE